MINAPTPMARVESLQGSDMPSSSSTVISISCFQTFITLTEVYKQEIYNYLDSSAFISITAPQLDCATCR